ncbi:DNA-binding response regulator [Aurantiacibacter spongiae]|uniref:DNA-binding response regulator n=2 Tax=Aurantiacibacter spongiae TaxID=2488860 RepID=A0A3N5CYF0_9SPHN|nr:DNA-binding response regulator [Aurantiacibacter spongiae]
MDRVTIFATDREVAQFDEFDQGEVVIRFALIGPHGPGGLVEQPCWFFVDWVMDTMSGLEMVRRLRADPRFAESHITMVLDEDDPDERRRSLKAGADDYMVGPLKRNAMLDRVLALFGSAVRPAARTALALGDLSINPAAEQARWRGRPVVLRPNEFRLLRFMAENPDRVLSRQELVEALGKAGDPNYLRTVDVWIKRLRMGLRDVDAGHLLRTVHGKGYVLDRP